MMSLARPFKIWISTIGENQETKILGATSVLSEARPLRQLALLPDAVSNSWTWTWPAESNGSMRMVPQCLPYCKIIKAQAYPSVSVTAPCDAVALTTKMWDSNQTSIVDASLAVM